MQFEFDKMYYCRYMPLGFAKLNIYDALPCFLPIELIHGAHGPILLGINAHWIPLPLRAKYLQFIVNLSKQYENTGRFRVFYNTIKRIVPLSFTLMAVRKYYVARLSNVEIIEQDQWDRMNLMWGRYRARYMRRSISNPTKLHGARKNEHFY